MRYPNRRYGNPTQMAHYAIWYGSVSELAKSLKRSERSVRDWLSGKQRVPWWVPEIMRLQKLEHDHMVLQMTGRHVAARLGVATATATIVDAGARFLSKPAQPVLAGVRHRVSTVQHGRGPVLLVEVEPDSGSDEDQREIGTNVHSVFASKVVSR